MQGGEAVWHDVVACGAGPGTGRIAIRHARRSRGSPFRPAALGPAREGCATVSAMPLPDVPADPACTARGTRLPDQRRLRCRPSLACRSMLLSLFLAHAATALVAAEPGQNPPQTPCDLKLQSCIAECRAQHFAIDPKRNACTANCSAEAKRCVREPSSTAAPPGA